MRKRIAFALVFLLAIGVLVLFFSPAAYFRLLGLLRQEAVFDGRPTSYWLAALKKDPFLGANPPKEVGKILREGGAPAVPVLLDMLREGDAATRSEILLTLGLMEPDAATVRPALVRALQTEEADGCFDSEFYVLEHVDRPAAVAALVAVLQHHPSAARRIRAAHLLGKLSGPEVAAGLRSAFADPDASVRVQAAQALWESDPQATDAIAFLGVMLGSADERGRREAIGALSMRGWVSSAVVRQVVLQALGDANSERRKDALDVLCSLRWEQSVLPAVLAALKDSVPEVRSRAAAALSRAHGKPFTLDDYAILAALAKAMHDPDPQVRRNATLSLARPGLGAPFAVPALVDWLRTSEDPFTRGLAAQDLRGLGRQAEPAIPALVAAAEHDPSEDVRKTALETLGFLGPKAHEAAVPFLIRALRSPSRSRPSTLSALAEVGPEAAPAVPALLELLEAQGELRISVMTTLGAIGPEARAAVPMLTAALDKKEPRYLRCTAAEAVWKIEPQNERIVPALRDILRGPKTDTANRAQAIRVLGQIGPKAKAAVPDLAKIIQDDEVAMRLAAIATVAEIGSGAQAAIPALTAALDKKEFPSIRCAAAGALWKITGEPNQVVPVLVGIALDLDVVAPERRQSAELLRGIGPKAKAAVPALVTAMQDSNPALREPATSILAAIDPATAARLTRKRVAAEPGNPAGSASGIQSPPR
jgi:HEAT repeat protein